MFYTLVMAASVIAASLFVISLSLYVLFLSPGDSDELVLAGLPLLGRRGSSVAELARTLAISERALRRRFNAAIGYGPKRLDRIIRFRRLLRLTALRGQGGLAAAAAELGYADQPHLTREVRELSGLTPVELLAIT